MKNALIQSILYLSALPLINAFIPPSIESSRHINSRTKLQSEKGNHYYTTTTTSRRKCITQTIKTASSTTAAIFYSATAHPANTNAMVNFDPARYGDKELKIATGTRLRQNIRDAMTKDLKLAPLFIELVIHDALTYNAATGKGGPDGSIISIVLKPNVNVNTPKSSLERLKPAAVAVNDIVERMIRSNAVTYADALSFAGAEAMEYMNGPKTTLQLGKLDGVSADADTTYTYTYNYPDLFDGNPIEIIKAFKGSGLTERDLAVLYGGMIAVRRATEQAIANSIDTTRTSIQENTDEENEMGDEQIVIANTFGAAPFGNFVGGQIDENIFASIVADLQRKDIDAVGVFRDEMVGDWAQKYAKKQYIFTKDYPSAYSKLISLGLGGGAI